LSGFPESSLSAGSFSQTDEYAAGADLIIVAPTDALVDVAAVTRTRDDGNTVPVLVLGEAKESAWPVDTDFLARPYSIGHLLNHVCHAVSRPVDDSRPTAVARSADKYEDLFQRASDAILLLDYQTSEIIEANDRATQLHGYTPEELIGLSLLELELVPREEHDALRLNTRAMTAAQSSLSVSYRTHIKKDGTQIQVRISGTLIEYDGRVVFQDIVRDETKQAQTEAALRSQSFALENTNVELKREVAERKRIAAELRQLSLTDDLTKLANRRAFEARFEQEWRRAARAEDPVCVLLVDIDYFKKVNDTYGHAVGDEVLRAVGAALTQHCQRASELAARYGGEEFVVLLYGVGAIEGERTAEVLRKSLAELRIPHDSAGFPVLNGLRMGGRQQPETLLSNCRVDREAYDRSPRHGILLP
jgi:diguanylate cyclase (GGDEF)-like protein/PAS domain S-box-containing protein